MLDPEYTVPDGFSPPLSRVTPNDHSAWIYVSAILGLCCSLVFCAVRVLVRSMITGGFGSDDYIFYTAMGLAIIQSGITLGACSNGMGMSFDLLSSEKQAQVQRSYYAGNFFFILAIALSKISVIAFLRRISRMKSHRITFNSAIGLVAAWTVGSMFALALQCDLSQPWVIAAAQCPGIALRWQVINAIDMATELALIGLVVFLVFSLQTPVSSKIMVVYIFSHRLILLVLIGFRMATFDEAAYTRDPFISNAPFIAWTQAELSASLITATIPTFRNFLKSLSTGFGGIGVSSSQGYVYGYGSEGRTRMKPASKDLISSFKMSKLRSATRSASGSRHATDLAEATDDQIHQSQSRFNKVDPLTGRSGGSEATAHWSAGTAGSDSGANAEVTSIGSDGSRRMIIRKEMKYTIKTEARS